MDDIMKPDMSDPVDEKMSKPSPNPEAQVYCATVIANLEGWRGRALPYTKEGRRLEIAQLDARVRRLENSALVNSPPPMDMPSWDSLSWRVARLHRKMPAGNLGRLYSAPLHITATEDMLRSVLVSIGGVGPHSWTSFVEDEESLEGDDLLQAAAQFLCFLAGKRGWKFIGSFGLRVNYSLALDFSLDADVNPGAYRWLGPQPTGVMRPAGPPLPPKSCCNCSCSCHGAKEVAKPRVISVTKFKPASRTGVVARVFRKLAFWRRHSDEDTDSDASSISTGSSATVA